jgi:capsular exopolysaccharide synthesis family protein
MKVPDAAHGPFAEALRSLRTSLVLPHSSDAAKVFLITSSQEGEGKSTVSLSLATVLAQQGAQVLLVDADLRRQVLHERMGLHISGGLSAALTSAGNYAPQAVENIPNLYAVCGGTVPEYPSELLGSKKMRTLLDKWRSKYDFILIDGPPVLPVADAIVLEQLCDAVLMVARHGVTEKKAMQRSYRAITRQLPQGVALGTVLNAVPAHSSSFYEYYGYRSRSSGGEGWRNETHA